MTKVRNSAKKGAATRRPAPAPQPAPEGRREQAKLEKRERIRAAAWELFTTVGYDETTTKLVAERADVAAGTLFLYASDKADLLCMVMHDRLAAVVDARFSTLPAKAPLVEQLIHVFRGPFQMYAEHPGIARAFVAAFPSATGPNGQAAHAMTFGFLHRLGGLIAAAQARGEVAADVEPFLAASNVFSLYFGALIAWISGHATLETALVPLLSTSLELQMRGLRAR